MLLPFIIWWDGRLSTRKNQKVWVQILTLFLSKCDWSHHCNFCGLSPLPIKWVCQWATPGWGARSAVVSDSRIHRDIVSPSCDSAWLLSHVRYACYDFCEYCFIMILNSERHTNQTCFLPGCVFYPSSLWWQDTQHTWDFALYWLDRRPGRALDRTYNSAFLIHRAIA